MIVYVVFCDDVMVRAFDSQEKAENIIAVLKGSPACKDWGVYKIERIGVE